MNRLEKLSCKDIGASLRETGSREPSPSSTGLGPTGFDPARFRDLADKIEGNKPRRGIKDWSCQFEQAFELCFPGPAKILAVEYEEWTAEYTEWQRRQSEFHQFLDASAYLDAAWSLLAPHTLWAVGSMEDGPFGRLCWPMPDGGYGGGYVEGCARTGALSLLAAALRGHAIAMEARQGGDGATRLHPKDDSAAPKGIAHD